DDADIAKPANTPVERARNVAKVTVDDRLDMPLITRLRPATLVVTTGSLGALIRDCDELARAKPIEIAALAPHVRDQRPVVPTDESNERGEVELRRNPCLV